MKFELDNILIDDIIFHMENQDGEFYLDTREGYVVNPDLEDNFDEDEDDDDDDDRYISLPSWDSNDGFRLMEKFAASLKNPVARHDLGVALNRNKGVFRAFRNALEQYPEIEKMWFNYKEKKMKEEVIDWYNSLREEWGMEPIGIEPEDTSSLVLEDFVIRKDENADSYSLSFIAENAAGQNCGSICGSFKSAHLHINSLTVNKEYRGLGLGKALLAKLLEEVDGKTVTIDLPAEFDFFSRALHLEGFIPYSQTFILNK